MVELKKIVTFHFFYMWVVELIICFFPDFIFFGLLFSFFSLIGVFFVYFTRVTPLCAFLMRLNYVSENVTN